MPVPNAARLPMPPTSRRAPLGALLLLVAGMLAVPRAVAAAGIGHPRQNLLGSELLGRGFVTLNYERRLVHGLGVGGGIGIGGNLYISYVPGQVHSVYLSAGVGYIPGLFLLEDSRLVQGTVGYQFQSASGFFVRPMVTTFYRREYEGVRAWPGLAIGGSF